VSSAGFEMKYILASSSPRRKELFSYIVPNFEQMVPNILELPRQGETAEDYCLRNACEKAAVIFQKRPDAIVLAADTIVVCEGRLLEKPTDPSSAYEMIRFLSNREHDVFTCYSIQAPDAKAIERKVQSKVLFRDLFPEEIDAYIRTDEPYDKAGGYAIQGRSATFIRSIQGSYTNVMGLPLAEVYEDLQALLR
jgi:septum formation protein